MRTLIVFAVLAAVLYAGFSLMLYFLQDRLVFLPHMPGRELDTTPALLKLDYEDAWIDTEDGERLHGWFVPSETRRGALLFFHGNAGNISHRVDNLRLLRQLGLAVFIISYATARLWQSWGIEPAACLGHSLGEYSALAAAQSVTKEGAFAMVMKRGELMHRESLRNIGAMHAIVGLEIEDIQAILPRGQEKGTVSIANHNMRQQIVITGSPAAVETAAEMAKVFELAVQAEVERDVETRRAEFGDNALDHPLPRTGEQYRRAPIASGDLP